MLKNITSWFRATFGDFSTPLSSAIESTVHWYRDNPAKETP
jgi:hypothetical protein